MAVGPSTIAKMKLSEWVSITVAIVTLAIGCYASIASAKSQQQVDQTRNDARFVATDARLDEMVKWQEEATESRKKLFDLLYQINGSVQRIEGQLSK